MEFKLQQNNIFCIFFFFWDFGFQSQTETMVTNQNPKFVNKLLYLLYVEFCVQVCIIVFNQRHKTNDPLGTWKLILAAMALVCRDWCTVQMWMRQSAESSWCGQALKKQWCLETHYLFDLVFKVCIICVVDHLGQTNLFCCGLVGKKKKERKKEIHQ